MQFPTADEQAFGDTWTSPPSGKLSEELQREESDTGPPSASGDDAPSVTFASEPESVGLLPPSFFVVVVESLPASVGGG
jgi:hypothetical protein